MKSSPKVALIVVIIIAAIILIIAGLTSPSSNITTDVQTPVAQAPTERAATLTLTDPISGTVKVGEVQHITWTSQNYASPTVTINLLRQESANPVSYKLIRTIAAFTQNDGDAVWVPSKTEIGQNVVIEVACTVTNESCKASRSVAPIAVVDAGRTSNTASVYSAFEQSQNK